MLTAARRRLGALPLRVRLVAGFVVAITLVLSAAGAFVYWRVAYALDLRLNNDLRAEAAGLAPLITEQGTLSDDPGSGRPAGVQLYQVLDDRGRVLASGGELGPAPVLTPGRAHAALDGEVVADVGALLPISRRPLRLLAVPVRGPGAARVLVVADRRDQRDEALRELLGQLALAGLGALVVTAVVGERLAKAALTPVERYRARAAEIAGGAIHVRLDVPTGRDDEVTRLGHTLNQVLDALEHALDRERQFTQNASHELRTPLTLLSTRVQLSLRRTRTVAEQESTLRELGQDIDALSGLAEQLLTLSTSDTGDTSGPAPVGLAGGCDLAAVTQSVTDNWSRVEAEAPGLRGGGSTDPTVSYTASLGLGPIPVVIGDGALRQVLNNLIGNALLHGHPPVQLALRVTEGTAVLTVTDHGPGIDPAFLPDAAERFSRAATARGRPGAGLGLSLVRAVVERNGGELRLCSAGVHHRYGDRFALPCAHPELGTSASVLLGVQ